MYCSVNSLSQRNLKLKVRTVFQNVWGVYKYHGNPYIQGTTVPCDNCGLFSERFGTQLSFDICCAVKSLKVEET